MLEKLRGRDDSPATHLRQILHAAEHLAVLRIRPKLHQKATVLHDDFTNLLHSRHLWAIDAMNCARSVLMWSSLVLRCRDLNVCAAIVLRSPRICQSCAPYSRLRLLRVSLACEQHVKQQCLVLYRYTSSLHQVRFGTRCRDGSSAALVSHQVVERSF